MRACGNVIGGLGLIGLTSSAIRINYLWMRTPTPASISFRKF
jgi:hypothetical protein